MALPLPILSMIRLNKTMDKANGHKPTPIISPIWVFVRLNSIPHSEMSIARSIKPNDVAIKATKQALNRLIFDLESIVRFKFSFSFTYSIKASIVSQKYQEFSCCVPGWLSCLQNHRTGIPLPR